MFPAQIPACLQHARCKSAEQMTTTSSVLQTVLIFGARISVTLRSQRIPRRGDLRKSAREQHGWNEKPFVTFQTSTLEQLPMRSDAPCFLIRTWTVTHSLYVFPELLQTEVNLTGQPPSLYPDQTNKQTDRQTGRSSDTRGFYMWPLEMALGTLTWWVKWNETYNLHLSSVSRTEIKDKFLF